MLCDAIELTSTNKYDKDSRETRGDMNISKEITKENRE